MIFLIVLIAYYWLLECRPLCTASYYYNRVSNGGELSPYHFHLVDRILHGVVTALTFSVAWYTLKNHCKKQRRWLISFLAALIFGIHPVHVEAVANSTGRAEVLCALFYFVGFLTYAGICETRAGRSSLLVGAISVILTLFFAFMSVLSKEHGITMPVMCIIWDAYVGTNTSLRQLFGGGRGEDESDNEDKNDNASNGNSKKGRKKQGRLFLIRVICMVVGTLYLAYWRLSKNGESNPNASFVCEQNPAACEPNRLYRFFHFSYLWCFNFWLMLYPLDLSPDWSGDAIPMMGEHWRTDPRFPCVMVLCIAICIFMLESIKSALGSPAVEALNNNKESSEKNHICSSKENGRRIFITSTIWMLLPFLMSSNLVVYVGFVIAERILYLPSFGFCLLFVKLLIDWMDRVKSKKREVITTLITLLIISVYTAKQQAQTERWSNGVLLWGDSFKLNPKSCVSGQSYGMALVNAGRNVDAMDVLTSLNREELAAKMYTKAVNGHDLEMDEESKKLREIRRTTNILQSRFKFTTAMGNGGHCNQARSLIDDGLIVAENIHRDLLIMKQSGAGGNERQVDSAISRNMKNKAYLSVVRSRCSENLADMINHAVAAATLFPGDPFFMNHANQVGRTAEQVQAAGIDPKLVKLSWTITEGQTAVLSFGT